MFDLDDCFKEIIQKYIPNRYKVWSDDLVYSKVYMILQKKCLKKNVAMWGVGDINNIPKTYVSRFLSTFADSLQNTKCVIDVRKELRGKEILSIPIILPSDIDKFDVDIILITSYRSRKYIAKEIETSCPSIPYLDVYEELEKMGFSTDVDIFVENDKYINLYDQRTRYEMASDIDDKKTQCDKLLAMYADIKDIFCMFKIIEECTIEDALYIRKLQNLKKDLLSLQNKIKQEIRNRNDIIVWFQDAFRNIDWYDSDNKKFKILKNISKKSVCFVNSYATAPVTYESMYSIITGKMPLDGKVYDSRFKFDVEKFEFLNKSLNKKYDLRFYTDERFDIFFPHKKLKTYYRKYIPEIIWEILSQMCNGKSEKIVHFAYAFKELHVPFMCGFFSRKPIRTIFSKMGLEDENVDWKKVKVQFDDCLKYLDFELEYFFDLIGSETSIVLFSDHAHIVYDENENKPFYLYYDNLEKSVKNVFMIYKKNWKHKVYNDMVSMVDFNKIASLVFSQKVLQLPKRDRIYYQYYPIQNITIRENAKKFNGEDYIDGIDCCYDGKNLEINTPHIKEIKKITN